ncbi:MAG TPA: TIGR02147 family protein [Fibrobacteria bacterium]|nr:TIGR02147 family protein [Fibrobacteria bacterium]HOX53486.1 TIGR02147 family protein [Fibrobacteria bacterium]
MQDIFEYTNYRKYLSDLYAQRKAANPSFSYRHIAQKAGFASPSFIGKILSGETNISHQTLLRLVDVFQLAGPEAEFFELMVYYDLAQTEYDKRHYFQRMNALRTRHGVQPIETLESLHSAWYVPPLLNLIELGLFQGNFTELGRLVTPPISGQEARLGVELLLMGGHIRREENGTYVTEARRPSSAPGLQEPPSSVWAPAEDEVNVSHLLATLPPSTPPALARRLQRMHDELLDLLRRAHKEDFPLD